MSRIPQHFIDSIVARSDVVELINSRVPLKKAGHEFKACCPFHDEKTPSFTVSPAKQFYHCFGCGAHGTSIGFLMEYERLSFVEAVEELAGRLGLEVPREGGEAAPRTDPGLFDVLEKTARYYQEQLKDFQPAIDYLKNRGLSGAIAREFGIGYAPKRWDALLSDLGASKQTLLDAGLVIQRDEGSGFYDRFRGRVMFPIRDHRGQVLAFGGRALDDDGPKYLNSPETEVFHKGRELYGLFEARRSRADLASLLVVEGYMDVVSLAQHGVLNALATLGTATTDEHLRRLFRVAGEVVFCFDGDRAGREAAWRALNVSLKHIRDGRQIRFLFLPDGEDPDTLVRAEGADGFNARLAVAEPLSAFLIRHLSEEVDLQHLDGRAKLWELAAPLLAQIPEGIYRQLLEEELLQVVGLSRDQLSVKARNTATRDKRPRRPRADAGRRGLLTQAITLLLHYPAIAAEVPAPSALHHLAQPGMDILLRLLDELAEEPHLTTGGVLERWRDDRYAQRLGELALSEALLPDAEQAAAELRDLLDKLLTAAAAERLEELVTRSAESGLDEAERQELKTLLADRGRS